MSGPFPLNPEQLADRVARELQEGWCVNLGIGLPLLVSDRIPLDREVLLHSENGILGMGPRPAPGDEDPDLINAGKEPVTLRPGGTFFSQAEAFAMIRAGYVDVAVIGAMQVSAAGDLANWRLPSQRLGNVGGAMDLAASAREVWVMMTHVAKDGSPKLLAECSLPLTAPRCVTRVFTDIAVLDVVEGGLLLRETAPGWTVAEVQQRTGTPSPHSMTTGLTPRDCSTKVCLLVQ